MVKDLPDNFAKELKSNEDTEKLYKLIYNDSNRKDYKKYLMELYDVIKEKFNSEEDQLAFLTYVFELANTTNFHHKQDYYYFISHIKDHIKQIRPKESSFYYNYALTFPKKDQSDIILHLDRIFSEVSLLMKDICDHPFQYTKNEIKSKVGSHFLYLRGFHPLSQSLINQNLKVHELVNAAADGAMEYLYTCADRAKKGETYCDECNPVICLKRDEKIKH